MSLISGRQQNAASCDSPRRATYGVRGGPVLSMREAAHCQQANLARDKFQVIRNKHNLSGNAYDGDGNRENEK